VQPKKLHERVAVFLGSRNEVEQVTGITGPDEK